MSNTALTPDTFTLDYTDPSFIENPYPTYKLLREESPFFYYEGGNGWLATKYADVAMLLKDPRVTTSFNHWEHAPPTQSEEDMCDFDRLMNSSLMQLDRDAHLRIRKLAFSAFAPQIIQKSKPQITDLVESIFDELPNQKQFNFAESITHPVSIRTISYLLGVSPQDEAVFDRMAEAIMIGMNPMWSPEERARATAGVTDGLNMIRDLVEFRRKNPDGFFLSTLIQAEESGDSLSTWELQALVGILLAVGMVTASNGMNKLTWTLLEDPIKFNTVASDSSLFLPALLETFRLRFFSSLGFRRFALEDFILHGHRIKKGQMLYLCMGSALRDESVFEDADAFKIDRDQSKNLCFGLGAHYCMGSNLAKLQGEVVFDTLTNRFPNVSLDRPPVFDIVTLHNNIKELWLNT